MLLSILILKVWKEQVLKEKLDMLALMERRVTKVTQVQEENVVTRQTVHQLMFPLNSEGTKETGERLVLQVWLSHTII